MYSFRHAALLATLLLLASPGCQRAEPLEEKVAAGTPMDFARSKSRLAEAVAPDQARDFDDCVQEIKFKVMRDQEASGTAAVDEATRAKIDGHTVREILAMGFDAKLSRLRDEQAQCEQMLKENATLSTAPGDTASADYLRRKQQDQTARLKKLGDEISAVEAKRAQIAGPAVHGANPVSPEPPDAEPVLSRKK